MLYEDDEDDPLLQLETDLTESLQQDEAETLQQDEAEGCSLTTWLQAVLYHFVAKPVVKMRWFILGKAQQTHLNRGVGKSPAISLRVGVGLGGSKTY